MDFVWYDGEEKELDSIAFELKNNKVLICDTDTVPGVLSLNKNNIYKIKKRPKNKKIITFISKLSQIESEKRTEFLKVAKHFWPGKLTIIYNGISYRMPNKPFLLKIIDRVGPLYSSSANISGYPVIQKYEDVLNYFSEFKNIIIYMKIDNFDNHQASTIYDFDKDKILREGDITYEQIKNIINK